MSKKTSKTSQSDYPRSRSKSDRGRAFSAGIEGAAKIVGASIPNKVDFGNEIDEMQIFKSIDVMKSRFDRRSLFMEQIYSVISGFTDKYYGKLFKEKENGYSKESSATFMHISKLSDELANQLDNIDPDLGESLAYYVRSLDQIRGSIGELRDASDSAAWKMIEDIPRKLRGRPRKDDLGYLIKRLANLYEIWSEKKFTFDKFKDSEGEYGAITEGHQFVCHIIDTINVLQLGDDKISSKAVATECERAVKNLRSSSLLRKNPSNT